MSRLLTVDIFPHITMMQEMLDIVDRIGYQAMFDEKDICEAIDFAEENGFPVVEVNLNCPHFSPESVDRVGRLRVRQYSESKRVRLILHAPEGLSMMNVQAAVRKASVEIIKQLMDFGNQIGADRMTYHLGSSVPMVVCGERRQLHTLYTREYGGALMKSLEEIGEYSENRLLPCVENTSGFRYDFAAEVLAEFLRNGFYLTWDIGHTNYLKGRGRQEEIDYFLKHRDRIRVVHIHDNYGSRDEHNVVGDGTVDFTHCLSLLDSPLTELIFEVRPRENALLCRENLRRMIVEDSRRVT